MAAAAAAAVGGPQSSQPEVPAQGLALDKAATAAHLKAALPCDGFNILQNNGEAAGQTVKHLHFHIVPRSGTEPIVFESRPGDMQELAALAARVKMA